MHGQFMTTCCRPVLGEFKAVFVFVQMNPVVMKVIIAHHSEKLTPSHTFQILEKFTRHYLDEDFGLHNSVC